VLWGEIDSTAAWVNDETWTLSEDFSTDTDNLLTVTFSDQNGAITLGSFEQAFRTGTNSAESFQITADQFNTDSWDNDGDGVSNYNELVAGANPDGVSSPVAAVASLELVPDKTFRITWQPSEGAEFYRVLENKDGNSGFTQIGEDFNLSVQLYDHRVALHRRFNASYIVQSCNSAGCVDSDRQFVAGSLDQAIGYLKATNTGSGDYFGVGLSLSVDGGTLAVGASRESEQDSEFDRLRSGGVYVFVLINNTWRQQAHLKASNAESFDEFGAKVSLSANGNTLAVGAASESSSAAGIDGNQSDNSFERSGAVYVFERTSDTWQQEAYIKASNPTREARFGYNLSLSGDGNTLAISPQFENTTAGRSGAVYMFSRTNNSWEQQAFLKASNPGVRDSFGSGLAISEDGNNLAVGAPGERSSATGINGDQTDNSTSGAGAVYVFERSNNEWQQHAYIKASNSGDGDSFGSTLSIDADGDTLAIGAFGESSSANGINGDQADNSEIFSGAVYVFERSNNTWQQQAYVKASNPGNMDQFSGPFAFVGVGRGKTVNLSGDGNTLAVGAFHEQSAATGLNGNQNDNSMEEAGAVYVFEHSNGIWQQRAYVKSSNTEEGDLFGYNVSLNQDGSTLAVSAPFEDSSTTGINSSPNNLSGKSGAVYLY